jgi:hypothetical protein
VVIYIIEAKQKIQTLKGTSLDSFDTKLSQTLRGVQVKAKGTRFNLTQSIASLPPAIRHLGRIAAVPPINLVSNAFAYEGRLLTYSLHGPAPNTHNPPNDITTIETKTTQISHHVAFYSLRRRRLRNTSSPCHSRLVHRRSSIPLHLHLDIDPRCPPCLPSTEFRRRLPRRRRPCPTYTCASLSATSPR